MRLILTIAAATMAAAVPATALAATSGDDRTLRSSTTRTTTSQVKTERVTAAQRDRAIAAARRAVPAGARVTKVERDRHTGDRTVYEVELRTSTTEYDVHLDRRFRVVEVKRDRLGDADHGRGRDHAEDEDHGGRGRDHAEDD